jgi:metal-sulfur cluster biosynthetic enzyme
MNHEEVIRRAREALRDVYDPELGIDVVSLGLVYDLSFEGDQLAIAMTLTTPGCPVSKSLPEEAFRVVSAAVEPLGCEVALRIVWDPPWTPALMDERAAATLGFG